MQEFKNKDCAIFADIFIKCIQTQDSKLKTECYEFSKILGNSIYDTYIKCKKNIK